ncbi:MAG: LysR family transcriptional regulator [Bacillota bacterium]|uniref:LysR family transcriptional regulator n=1 Tax=Virgibacillus salarius TaxID=447199 RepID=A0A941ICL7_9BACI|nr:MULTISPECIES: LysR family transcriptional regulator [Bacillaceae]NAZ08998.1 LysR family transcriptional regulator [Agaribacter marinus]MBR7796290.1 LysR family transcriptional regulator [Virgibacillus salarius]MCC2248522.1 LysR family transcriptional regulator [Virgibacillus sp. AGTR]MDY7043043.1 LysR family transcriptional regulator [Virgibacillus sp. M23]QRZ16617.1 LysR family transcriptional regulator [Virgibacillus sp. AGTR]
MEIRHLRYFQAIANEGQITRAANKLHMAQPPLSQSLKSLEEELGVKLLERNGRKMELTDAGTVLYNKINELFDTLEETITEVKETGTGTKGSISLGCVKTCFSHIPRQIKLFQEKYPHVHFYLKEGDSYSLAEQLSNRDIDIAIIRLPLEMQAFNSLSLPDEKYIVVMPEQWCESSMIATTMRQLSTFPLLLLHRISGIGQYELILDQFESFNLHPKIVCECPDVDMILQLVSEEVGATIVPESTLSGHQLRGLKTLTIEDNTIISQSSLIWLKDRYLSKSTRRFIELFQSEKLEKETIFE